MGTILCLMSNFLWMVVRYPHGSAVFFPIKVRLFRDATTFFLKSQGQVSGDTGRLSEEELLARALKYVEQGLLPFEDVERLRSDLELPAASVRSFSAMPLGKPVLRTNASLTPRKPWPKVVFSADHTPEDAVALAGLQPEVQA